MSWDWNQPSSCNFSLAIWRPCCHTPAFYQCIQMVEKRGFGCQSYGAGSPTSLRRITRFSYVVLFHACAAARKCRSPQKNYLVHFATVTQDVHLLLTYLRNYFVCRYSIHCRLQERSYWEARRPRKPRSCSRDIASEGGTNYPFIIYIYFVYL